METTDKEDKIVEIARFTHPDEAQPLLSLLQSEGIDCYLRNEFSNRILAGIVDIGGARIELLESQVPQALEIMEANGYDLPPEDEDTPEVKTIIGIAHHIPILNRFQPEHQLFIMIGLIGLCLVLLFLISMLLTNDTI